MSNKVERTAPEIRFKGFTDDWEKQKLINLAIFSKGRGYSKNDLQNTGSPIILYGRMYTDYKTVISEIDTYVEMKTDSSISEGNEVIIPASGETAQDISRASFIEKPGIILGGDLNVVRPNDSINPIFLVLTISNGAQQKEMIRRAQGKSIVHLHNSDLKNIILNYPVKEEQNRISRTFQNIDKLLTVQKRKLEALKQLKQALLQQMFPQKDEVNPRVRFANFHDDWQQRKLGELGEVFTGNTPSTTNTSYWDIKKNHIWVTPTDIKALTIEDSDRYLSDMGWNKARKVPKDSVLVTSIASIGKNTINKVPVAFNQQINAIVPHKNDAKFIISSISKEKNKFLAIAGQTATQIINKSEFKKFEISIASLNEQQKIGFYFTIIDNLTVIQNQKLDSLTSLKQSLLQKMFI